MNTKKEKILVLLMIGILFLGGCWTASPINQPPANSNLAPAIISTPIETVILGETYTYTVDATDSDGDALTYFLTTDPFTDMAINENSGVIIWISTATGSYNIAVEVSDGELSDIQTFTITVSEPEPINQSPLITSIPVTAVILGETYTYAMEATDPDGDILIYSLTACPEGMTIDSTTGTIAWTPTASGIFYIGVKVSDRESSDIRSFTIVVTKPELINQSPAISNLIADFSSIDINQSNTITCIATDQDGDTLTYTWTKTGGTINGSGSTITWTAPNTAGAYAITCTVSDGELTDIRIISILITEPKPEPNYPTYRAFFVGVGKYEATHSWALQSPAENTQKLEDLFLQCKFGEEETKFEIIEKLTNYDATKENILNGILEAFGEAEDNDVSYFYYMGHGGIKDRIPIITPTDYNFTLQTAITVHELEECLSQVLGTKVIFLETCHAGNFIDKSKGMLEAFEERSLGLLNKENNQVLASSKGSEYTWDGYNSEGSYFCRYLIEGCEDLQADINEDEIVDLSELYEYIKSHVTKQTVQIYPDNSIFSIMEY